MSLASFGMGLQGLSQGILNGIQIGNTINNARDSAERKQAAKDGIQLAVDRRKQSIADQIKLGGLDANGQQQYQVGDQTFADIDSAQKAAEKSAPDFYEVYNQVGAPRMRDTLLKQGNIEGAAAWDNWISQNKTQAGLKHWTKAVDLASNGDISGAAGALAKAYNTSGYYDDGMTVSNYSVDKDDKGNVTGINFEFKGQDGNTIKKSFNNVADFLHQGVAMLSPEQSFKYNLSQVDAQKKAQSDRDMKVLEANLKVGGATVVEGIKHKYRMEENKQSNDARMERTRIEIGGLSGGRGGKDDLSPTGRTIRDLEAVGVPRDRAISLATDSKSNPAAQRLQIYNSIVTATKAAGDDLPSDEEMSKRVDAAYRLINQLKNTGAGSSDDVPAQDAAPNDGGEDFSNLWQ